MSRAKKLKRKMSRLFLKAVRTKAAELEDFKHLDFAGMDIQRIAIALGRPRGGGLHLCTEWLYEYFKLDPANFTPTLFEELTQAARAKVRSMKAKVEARPVIPAAASKDFLQTFEWRRVRMEALKKYGARCQCCGASPADGVVMNVDHIKQRRIYPALALDVNNLQVLCGPCNHGKGNWDMTDWREKCLEQVGLSAEQSAHLKNL